MNAKLYLRFAGVAGRVLLAALLVTLPGQSAFAQEKGTPTVGAEANRPSVNTAKAANAQEAEQKKSPEPSSLVKPQEAQNERNESSVGQGMPPGNGSHEGIRVHGHWTIEVRNPDGSIVSHREFENALQTPSGALSALLSRGGSAGAWQVNLEDYVNGVPSPGLCGNTGTCVITEPGISGGSINSSNLTVAAPSGTYGGIVTLSGTVNVSSTGTILHVTSYLGLCAPTATPAACSTSTAGLSTQTFTSATLSPSVSIAAGQTIALTVTFTFS
jgi:hypothetical protein